MAFTAAVSNLIPGMMGLSVLGRSAQMIPSSQFWGNGKRKPKSKNMIKGFTNIMIGIPMIGATANLTSAL